MTDKEITQLIASLKWTFAKTYAKKSPHEYAICKTNEQHRDEVVRFMKHIFDKGETEWYYGHPFTVYRFDGRKYWCMAKSKEVISDDNYVLNRSMLDNVDITYS